MRACVLPWRDGTCVQCTWQVQWHRQAWHESSRTTLNRDLASTGRTLSVVHTTHVHNTPTRQRLWSKQLFEYKRFKELWKKRGTRMLYGGVSIGQSRHNNVPLHWCSAYIRSRRFSSSVTSMPLYDIIIIIIIIIWWLTSPQHDVKCVSQDTITDTFTLINVDTFRETERQTDRQTLFLSSSLVIMTIAGQWYCHIIRQKSDTVSGRGPYTHTHTHTHTPIQLHVTAYI